MEPRKKCFDRSKKHGFLSKNSLHFAFETARKKRNVPSVLLGFNGKSLRFSSQKHKKRNETARRVCAGSNNNPCGSCGLAVFLYS